MNDRQVVDTIVRTLIRMATHRAFRRVGLPFVILAAVVGVAASRLLHG